MARDPNPKAGPPLAGLHTMIWDHPPPQLLEQHLGRQLERIRISRNLTQKQLAAEAGLSTGTIARLENGDGASVHSLIRVLAALGLTDAFRGFLPDPSIRPVERLALKGQERRRVRHKAEKPTSGPWTWGEPE